MAFFKEDADYDVSKGLAKLLADRILSIGGKVKAGSSKRWAPDFDKLISVHGERYVTGIVQEYCLRIHDQTLPRIRSGKSFRKKFDVLVYRTDAGICDTDRIDEAVEVLVRKTPLRWPFDDSGEVAWLNIIYEGIKEVYPSYTEEQKQHLGPPKYVLCQWRIRCNTYAWSQGSRSFADQWFGGADDLFIYQMLRSML